MRVLEYPLRSLAGPGIAVGLMLLACRALAEPYDDALLRLEIPAGFEGPVTASQDAGVEVIAFRRPYASGAASTLLQITKFDAGPELAAMPASEREEIQESYLLQFLEGVARRRDSFEHSDPVGIELGGMPGAVTSWKGTVAGRQASGVMYSVVVGAIVVNFHTQDFEPVPADVRDAVLESIERVVFRHDETE